MDSGSSSHHSPPPFIDQLREEFLCAICLHILFEPTTTLCGHSFCRQCLQSAPKKFNQKCPMCRQMITSNEDSCNVNTILWNTIQLLFPQDVKERKATNFFNRQQPNGASSSGLMISRRNETTTLMPDFAEEAMFDISEFDDTLFAWLQEDSVEEDMSRTII